MKWSEDSFEVELKFVNSGAKISSPEAVIVELLLDSVQSNVELKDIQDSVLRFCSYVLFLKWQQETGAAGQCFRSQDSVR